MPSELLEFILAHEDAFKSRNRLSSLYSDFRHHKETNPEGYQANINAWKKALADAARAGVVPAQGGKHHLLNISAGEDLIRALQDENCGRPTCLPAVFHDAVSKNDFIPLSDFLNAQTSVYHKSWIPSPWAAVRWGLRQIGLLPGLGDEIAAADYVVLTNVETAAEAIIERMKESTSVDLIVSRLNFLKRFANVLNSFRPLTSADLNILLVHLARDKRAISYNDQTIKFKAETQPQPVPITSEDTAIANLRDTLARLHTQVAPLEQQIAVHDAAAKEAVKTKNMSKAKTALRQKKMAEAAFAQRTDLVLQLETVFGKLQQAVDHVEIVEAMKAGSSALQGLNEKVGGAEGVQAVIDDLREEMDTAEEINQIINESGEQVDEGEIDDEFAELEKQEKEKREQEEAAQTAARLAELEQAEKEKQEKAERAEEEKQKELQRAEADRAEKAKSTEEKIMQTSMDMSRLSFQNAPSATHEEDEEQNEPQALPA
ncbi:Snf7-domain-containing protein [Lophiotrema nucula]|uniref:Snf7-domain-containing protein n=1 Tax=Lophiotrema nucula TaxID=690887 RepID=A0A6A5ZQZ3_9PLEO|nr:Snf7-domain-containing protein [Lophiotrema nucula]